MSKSKYGDDDFYWAPQPQLMGRGWIAYKGGSSAPAAPDPYKTADAQTGMNKELAQFNADLNRTNASNPYGGSEWVKDANGVWTQNEYFAPEVTSAINKQMEAANTTADALSSAGQRARDSLSTPFQFNYDGIAAPTSMPTLDTSGVQGIVQDAPTYDSTYRDGVIKQVGDYLQGNITDQYNRDAEQTRNRLALQGFSIGSDASNVEQSLAAKTRDQAINDARVKAIATGQDVANSDYANRMTGFNSTNAARTQALANLLSTHGAQVNDTTTQQGLANDQYNQQYSAANNERSRYLNELTALMSGSQITPFSTGAKGGNATSMASGTDLTGLVNQQYGQQLDSYNAAQARSSGTLGSVLGAAGMVAGLAF